MKNGRELVTLFAVIIFIIGYVVVNNNVSDSCNHGNCKHGWNSKYNKEEKHTALLWMFGFPIISYLLISKVFDNSSKPTRKPTPSNTTTPKSVVARRVANSASQRRQYEIDLATSDKRVHERAQRHSNFSGINAKPICPRCGSDMKLRTARKGRNSGSQFWGCSKYPACKGTRNKAC
ncbi:topoisomerase DNA-binding C4 zinc finger domain-containing protein [Vibrio europaeus]|uniref:topoisomerase DNA-binding C4 zinc finger domain-containing protein n=1 Tax=Vibrio europaeus TaxID=300876 RepID=UPI0039E15A5D